LATIFLPIRGLRFDKLIRGTLWIDQVRISPEAAAHQPVSGKPSKRKL
jgi:hypothetical protein